MAAEAVYSLLLQARDVRLSSLRHLVVGTESGVDHSKPISAYLHGMLTRAGLSLPSATSSFQVQHACAAATMALLAVAGLLTAGGEGEFGVVVGSDVARYRRGTTAEITQGAGAAALLVERAPRLLELDLGSIGYSSHDVDDFFRPVGSPEAVVKGAYSMSCYAESLEEAFCDHCMRIGERPERVLADTDLFALHAPFRTMPQIALTRLCEHWLGLDKEGTQEFLASRGFTAGIEPIAASGNLYNASLATALAFVLYDRFRVLGPAIIGRRVLLASYGSGNTMIVAGGVVAEGAPEVIARWDLPRLLAVSRPASFGEYEAWMNRESSLASSSVGSRPSGSSFFLERIREDGYRLYRHTSEAEGRSPDLHPLPGQMREAVLSH